MLPYQQESHLKTPYIFVWKQLYLKNELGDLHFFIVEKWKKYSQEQI